MRPRSSVPEIVEFTCDPQLLNLSISPAQEVILRATHGLPLRGAEQHDLYIQDLLQRIGDDGVADADLSPVEQGAREWRESVITDLGGRSAITTAKLALITTATGSWIILSAIDHYILSLAATEGLTSRKHRKAWPIVETRARLAESFSRQLALIGLDKQTPPMQSIEDYLARGGCREPSTTTLDTASQTGDTEASS
jgi:hypothetical protein